MINQMLVKETKELIKSYKILILPLIFTVILIMQPIMLKLLPSLLQQEGTLPPGTVITMVEPVASDVLSSLLGQFEQLGVITIVLIMMGTIVEERASGVSAMVLVKPIGREKYYFTKLIIYGLLVIGSFIIGIGVSGYYTEILYSGVVWGNIFKGALVYIPNLILLISIVMFFSSFLKKQLAVAVSAIGVYTILAIVPKYLGDFISSISPGAGVSAANKILSGVPNVEFFKPVISVSILALVFILIGWYIFKNQEI